MAACHPKNSSELLCRTISVGNDISKRVMPMGHEATCEELGKRVKELERQVLIYRQAEEALQESEQRWRSLVESMNDGLLVRDENDVITYVNGRLSQLLGYSRDEVVGRPLAQFLDEANQVYYEAQLAKRLRGECDPYEITWTGKCGRKIATIMSPKPLFDSQAQVKGSFAVITDITSRKEAEEGLLKAWAELDEKVKERTAELARANSRLQDEIAERKRAEDALRREHSFRTTIIERAAEGLCVFHKTTKFPYHRFTVWNNRIAEITGYTGAEINELGWYQSLFPDPKAQEKAIERTTRMRKGEDVIDEEWEITRVDGEKRVVSISTSILQTDDGVTHALALVHDITRQKLAEEELSKYRKHLELLVTERTSEMTKTNALLQLEAAERRRANESLRKVNQRLQDIIDFLPDATFVIDKEKRVLAWNRAIEQMTGIGKKDILGQGDYAYAVPFYGKRRPILIDLVMSGAAGVEQRYDFVEKTEKDVWGEVFVPGTYEGKGAYLWGKASPLFDKNGNITGAIQSIRDISARKETEEELGKYRDHLEELVEERTIELARANKRLTVEIQERKKAEQTLREWQQMLQSVLDTIPVRVFWKNLDLDYLGCNRPFARDAGLQSPEEIVGRNDFEMGWAEQAELYRSDDRLVMETGRPKLGYEEPQTTPDGCRIWLRTNKVPLLDAEGRIKGVLGTYEDITKSKRIEEALQDSSQMLKLFAYTVAHDLKSPAIGIHGLTKRLCEHLKGVLDEKGRNYCDQILKVSEHIAALVEKINVYIATKEARPNIETSDIKEIFGMLKDEFSAQLSIRRIQWLEPEGEIEIRADRLSIVRTFRNLIDNALKYGGKRLSRISIGHEEAEAFHIFSVTDNGQGLRGVDPEKIFGLFQRHETSRGIEGAGLGLTIVKEIAEQHGGRLWIESSTDKATTFCISISKNL
jgi:PAS domain S-box-containing protein